MTKTRIVKKSPAWVKLGVGVLTFGLGYRLLSSVVYYSQMAEQGQGAEAWMFNPISLLDFTIPLSMDTNIILLSVMIGVMGIMGVIVYEDSQKNRRTGAEHGSAKWLDPSCSLEFRDKESYFNNQIFTQTEMYSRNMRVSGRNRNILLLGRPGTGKSRYYFKPNLLQRLEGSVVVTDPKGELLRDCGYALKQAGYTIKVLNLDEMWNSNHYNPFIYLKYVHEDTKEVCVNLTEEQIASRKYKLVDSDVLQIIDSIMKNTNGESKGGSQDPFWDKAEMLYLQSVMYYIVYNYPRHLQNFGSVLDLMRKSQAPEGEKSELDFYFEEWELGQIVTFKNEKGRLQKQRNWPRNKDGSTPEKSYIDQQPLEERANLYEDAEGYVRRKKWINEFGIPCVAEGINNVGIKQWKHFKSGVASEKTMASIMLSAASRLAPFNIPQVANFINDDDMELQRLGVAEDTPSAPGVESHGGRIIWFIVTKPSEQTFNFIANMFYTQCFQMIDIVAKKNKGSCPTPVDFYMDEWAQLGEIPRFVETLSYVRGLNCGITIGLQSLDQLKNVYKDSWQTAIDDCDFILYLGSTSKDTLEYFVTLLGEETISKRSSSRSYGKSGSSSHSDDVLGRKLVDIQELRTMGAGKCVFMDMKETRGAAYFSNLYDLSTHPRYGELYEPWNDKDVENLKREYRHGEELTKRNEILAFNRFYKSLGVDPNFIRFVRETRIVDGDTIAYENDMMSPEQFRALAA